MSIAKHLHCDRCGVELATLYAEGWKIKAIAPSRQRYKWDLCPECFAQSSLVALKKASDLREHRNDSVILSGGLLNSGPETAQNARSGELGG